MRQIWRRLHRYIGLTVALLVLEAALTGCLIAYQKQLDTWINPDLFTAPMQGNVLSTTALISRISQQRPQDKIVSLPLKYKSGESVRISIRPPVNAAERVAVDDELFVDPISGNILGSRIWGACSFERKQLIPCLYVLHYSLQLPGEIGLWVMGITALLWLCEALVGFYLTFPKTRAKQEARQVSTYLLPRHHKGWLQRWSKAWLIKPKTGKVRLNFDLHRAGGLWLLPLVLVFTISGISLTLRDAIFEPMVSIFSTFTPSPFDVREESGNPPAETELAFTDVLATAVNEAAKRGWKKKPNTLFYNPVFCLFGIGFGNDSGLGQWYLYFDGNSGKNVGAYVPGAGSKADVFEAWQFPLHSGRIAGLAGQIFISCIALAFVGQVVTGLYVWSKKIKGRS